MKHELRYAIRSLYRTPAFTLPALFSLSFGTGLALAVLGLFRIESLFPLQVKPAIGLDLIRSAGWTETWGWPMLMPAQIQNEGLEILLRTLVVVTALGLIIAGLNFFILLLRRASARRHEMAIRAALGASGRQLLMRPVVEGLVLGAVGVALGIGVGLVGASALRASWPHAVDVARIFELYPWIILFGLAGALFTPIISLVVSRAIAGLSDLLTPLTVGGRATADRSEGLLRDSLAVTQVAVSVMLLTGAALLVRETLPLAQATSLAFDPQDTLTVALDLGGDVPEEAERANIYESVLRQVESLPGIEAAGVSTPGTWAALGPVGFASAHCGNCYRGGMYMPVTVAAVRHHAVSPGFFAALGMRVSEGREFTTADRSVAPLVALVNRAFAAEEFENGQPIGRKVGVGGTRGAEYTIVGVVDDIDGQTAADIDHPAALYLPILQSAPRSVDLALRTRAATDELVPAIETIIADADAPLSVASVATMEERLAHDAAPLRWLGIQLAIVGAAALILALYGLYSVMRYIVLQRRREIGIRMALGARQRTVMKMIVGYGLKLSFIGGGLGLWGALSLVAWLKNLSPGLPIFDPVVYGGVLVVLTLVALAGASLPARSAARIEPAVALRGE